MKSLARAYALKKNKYAAGGSVMKGDACAEPDQDDMVSRIAAKRMSKGGQVANTDMGELEDMADSKPNNFDYLSLSDELDGSQPEDSNTHGNAQETSDRVDMVSRIMSSLRKRDRLPSPR